MPGRTPWVRHTIAGGWATDFGQVVDTQIPATLVMPIPFLLQADDVLFELHGGVRKSPGAAKLNSAVMESGAAIRSLFDAWFSGTGGAPTQRRVCDVGTKFKADNADGTFTDIATGLSATGVSCFAMLEDFLVRASTTDTFSKWDGTTYSAAAGTEVLNIQCVCEHKGYLFGGGAATAPSRLVYTDQFAPNNWDQHIDVSPDDGDGIKAVASHKGELLIFKGPYKGSIYRLTGSSSSDFTLVPFVKGGKDGAIGCAGANLLCPFGDDLAFGWSDGNIYTLSATANYGDYAEVALTRPIGTWIRDNCTFNQLHKGTLTADSQNGVLCYTLPAQGSAVPNTLITLDYRFSPPRISRQTSLSSKAYSVGRLVDSSASNRRIVMLGGADGYIRKWNQTTRTIDASTAIGMNVRTPFMSYGMPWLMKDLEAGSLAIANRSTGTITFGWQTLTGSQRSQTVQEGGQGVALDTFLLDTDTLANISYGERLFHLETGGEFKLIQYSIEQASSGQDCEVYAFAVKIKDGTESMSNDEG